MDKFYDVELRLKKKNKLLFHRDSVFLLELNELINKANKRAVILWVFDIVKELYEEYKILNLDTELLDKTISICDMWSKGEVKMPIAKRYILECYKKSREVELYPSYIISGIAQGLSTIHAKGHAIGLCIYYFSGMIYNGFTSSQVEKKIQEYISKLSNSIEYEKVCDRKWAKFLT